MAASAAAGVLSGRRASFGPMAASAFRVGLYSPRSALCKTNGRALRRRGVSGLFTATMAMLATAIARVARPAIAGRPSFRVLIGFLLEAKFRIQEYQTRQVAHRTHG